MSKNEFTCDCTVVHEDAVRDVASHMADEGLYIKTAAFFKVLGDTTRVKIISALDVREMCVCDIANVLSMTKSAVSHQLATLREAGFVRCRRDGKTAYYSLTDAHIRLMLLSGIEHVQE